MSEQATEGTSSGASNGVSDTGAAPATPGLMGDPRAAARAAGKAAFLSAVPDAKPEPAAEPVDEQEAAAADDEPEAVESEVEAEPEEAEPEVEEEPLAAKDADRDKRLDAAQKAEKRALERMQQERAKFDGERQQYLAERKRFEEEWKPRIESAQKFESLKEQAQYDLAGALEALGITDADYEYHAQQLYRLSPKGKADPKNRDAYERATREREHRNKLSQAEKRIAEMEKRMEERERAQIEERRLGALVQKAQASLGDETPIMRKRFESHPEAAQADFALAVKYFREQTGSEPDPADVIRELEAIEQENARVRGFTIPTKAAPKGAATPKTQTSPAEKTKSAPKKPTSEPAQTQPRSPRASREELRRQFLTTAGKGHTA